MKPLFVIFAGNWNQIGVVRGDRSQLVGLNHSPEWAKQLSVEEGAKAIAATLSSQGYKGGGVMLAIPSEWSLCATIPIEDLPKRNRRQLMIYRLEEHLPVAAEDLVVDFAANDLRGDRALGVAVVLSQLMPVLEALEHAGVWVRSISPTALLALQAIETEKAQEASRLDALLLGNCDGVEVLVFDRATGLIDEWSTQKDRVAIRIELRRLALLRPAPLTLGTFGIDRTETVAFAHEGEAEIKCLSLGSSNNEREYGQDSCALAAIRAARSILSDEQSALIELRRDAVAEPEPFKQVRTSLTWAVVAAVLFCLSLAGSLLMRAHAYSRLIEAAQVQERRVYQDALGKPPIGPNIKARLVSEDRRLAALSGTLASETTDSPFTGAKQPSLPQPVSSLLLLRDTLKSLPRDLRYRLLDLRFTADGIELGGECRTHGDVDAIAQGLRSIGGYAVDPPHSEIRGSGNVSVQDKGVSFTINARLIQISATGGAQP